MNPTDIKEGIAEQLNVPYGIDFAKLGEIQYLVDTVASVILGMIAYSIVALLTIVTAIDIAYITLPAFRERVQALKWDGSKHFYLRAVSRDAILAVEEAVLSGLGKSAVSIYLWRRLKTYIISMTILIIIVGGGTFIKNFIVKVIVTILRAFM